MCVGRKHTRELQAIDDMVVWKSVANMPGALGARLPGDAPPQADLVLQGQYDQVSFFCLDQRLLYSAAAVHLHRAQ